MVVPSPPLGGFGRGHPEGGNEGNQEEYYHEEEEEEEEKDGTLLREDESRAWTARALLTPNQDPQARGSDGKEEPHLSSAAAPLA
eukprot:122193-Pyramimonas_sp.AAC.1